MTPILNWEGKPPDFTPAIRRRPRSQGDNGRAESLCGAIVRGCKDADAIRIDCSYQPNSALVWQFAKLTVVDPVVEDVTRTVVGATYKNPKAGKIEPLHCDCMQIRQMGPRPVPVSIIGGRLDPFKSGGGRDGVGGLMIEGNIGPMLLIDGLKCPNTSVKIKPGGAWLMPLVRIIRSVCNPIIWPGVVLVQWDGVGEEPRPDSGANFKLERIHP